MTTEAIILAGGLGTRLKDVVQDIPKPMAPVRGKPFLAYQLEYLQHAGIKTVVLSVGYRQEAVRMYFLTNFQGTEVLYAVEDEPLGTGGGIRRALDLVHGHDVLVLNGDSFFEIDLPDFMSFHQANQSPFSMALRFQPETARFGVVETDDMHRITGFREKVPGQQGGWINGGVYLINTRFYRDCSDTERFSLEHDFLPRCTERHSLYGYPATGYFIDIGTPESYRKAQDEFVRFEHQ